MKGPERGGFPISNNVVCVQSCDGSRQGRIQDSGKGGVGTAVTRQRRVTSVTMYMHSACITTRSCRVGPKIPAG